MLLGLNRYFRRLRLTTESSALEPIKMAQYEFQGGLLLHHLDSYTKDSALKPLKSHGRLLVENHIRTMV